ncbi:MAG: hypothetical protein ACJ8R9_20540 [Steroidobacteraceae bacterium]
MPMTDWEVILRDGWQESLEEISGTLKVPGELRRIDRMGAAHPNS